MKRIFICKVLLSLLLCRLLMIKIFCACVRSNLCISAAQFVLRHVRYRCSIPAFWLIIFRPWAQIIWDPCSLLLTLIFFVTYQIKIHSFLSLLCPLWHITSLVSAYLYHSIHRRSYSLPSYLYAFATLRISHIKKFKLLCNTASPDVPKKMLFPYKCTYSVNTTVYFHK